MGGQEQLRQSQQAQAGGTGRVYSATNDSSGVAAGAAYRNVPETNFLVCSTSTVWPPRAQ